jgi:hypothetical protein
MGPVKELCDLLQRIAFLPAIPHHRLVGFGVMDARFSGHDATLLISLRDSSVLRRSVESAVGSGTPRTLFLLVSALPVFRHVEQSSEWATRAGVSSKLVTEDQVTFFRGPSTASQAHQAAPTPPLPDRIVCAGAVTHSVKYQSLADQVRLAGGESCALLDTIAGLVLRCATR